MHPQQPEGGSSDQGWVVETRELSFVVLNLRGLLGIPGAYLADSWVNEPGAQTRGLEVLGDGGHSPSRDLNKNGSRNKKEGSQCRNHHGACVIFLGISSAATL